MTVLCLPHSPHTTSAGLRPFTRPCLSGKGGLSAGFHHHVLWFDILFWTVRVRVVPTRTSLRHRFIGIEDLEDRSPSLGGHGCVRLSGIHEDLPPAGSRTCSNTTPSLLTQRQAPTHGAWQGGAFLHPLAAHPLRLIILDNLRRAHFRFVRILPDVTKSASLAQKVPALVQFDLDLGQPLPIGFAQRSRFVQSMLLCDQALDMIEDRLIFDVILHESLLEHGCDRSGQAFMLRPPGTSVNRGAGYRHGEEVEEQKGVAAYTWLFFQARLGTAVRRRMIEL